MDLRGSARALRRLSEIQAQLLSARHAAKMSQQSLSDQLHVASRTLRDWEKGYDTPSMKHLITWAHLLGFRLVIVDPLESSEPAPVELESDESFLHHEMRRLVEPLWRNRKARNLSQRDLALLLGVSRASVQRWEDSEKFPRPIALIAWAGRLDCSVALNQGTNSVGTPPQQPENDGD